MKQTCNHDLYIRPPPVSTENGRFSHCRENLRENNLTFSKELLANIYFRENSHFSLSFFKKDKTYQHHVEKNHFL
jgi:hypothetical protein